MIRITYHACILTCMLSIGTTITVTTNKAGSIH